MTKVTETLVLLLLGDKDSQPGMLKAKARGLRPCASIVLL